uniref:Guanylyl cyclase-activating protein 2-like n=1 Tax=Nothobranchius furzeri TaxID=105023 RepID=A0A8C6MBE1_NOTFU
MMFDIMGQTQGTAGTEVTSESIQELYRKFTSECPSGNLHLHEFKKFFGVNSKSAEEELAYAEIVFRSFDTNKDGQLDFMEFVAAVNLIFRGKLIDKLKWSFKVYDKDGNGSLTKQEVKHVVSVSTVADLQTLLTWNGFCLQLGCFLYSAVLALRHNLEDSENKWFWFSTEENLSNQITFCWFGVPRNLKEAFNTLE